MSDNQQEMEDGTKAQRAMHKFWPAHHGNYTVSVIQRNGYEEAIMKRLGVVMGIMRRPSLHRRRANFRASNMRALANG